MKTNRFDYPNQPVRSDDISDTGTVAAVGSNIDPTDFTRTLNDIIATCTKEYLESINMDDLPSPDEVEHQLINSIRGEILLANETLPKGSKMQVPQKLNPSQLADIMLFTHRIVRVKCAGESGDPSYDLLAIYQDTGENKGLYTADDNEIKRICMNYNYSISSKEMSEVMEKLFFKAPRVSRTTDRDLIAVNNGIFNFATKELKSFSPDYVFMSKSKVNYNHAAQNVIIRNPDGTYWDIESWMADLFDDPELTQVAWEILSAIIRPFVRWNKSAWFYSESGNNGKGTLCELMRSMCGEGSYASLSLEDFSKDFLLEPLIRANAIIRDENDVGTYIDKAANLKAVITNDVISINRKHKTPISYQFYGFMVQCLNEYPRVKDKSDSFYRRQLFVPFKKCFTGMERKYIKDDYLHRPEVLEYVLYKVLNMNFYTLSEPAACSLALADYKEFNDPVRQFLDEMLPQFVWDLLPFSFLYDAYKAWERKNNPNGVIQGRNTFITEVLNIISSSSGFDDWYCRGRGVLVKTGHKMDLPEPLIATYGLSDWKNPRYTGPDTDIICSPVLSQSYRGLLRTNANGGNDDEV